MNDKQTHVGIETGIPSHDPIDDDGRNTTSTQQPNANDTIPAQPEPTDDEHGKKKPDPNEKGRYWAGLIYPGDSCPDDWQSIMKLSGLQILVSPLHDQDLVDGSDDELKKPHRHVIAIWRNTTTRRNAQKFFQQFNGPETILRLESPRGMARYLIHMDDPDKAQYRPEDVIEFNGADWAKLALDETGTSEAAAIMQLVEGYDVTGYFALLQLCQQQSSELFVFATNRPYFCKEVIWSYQHSANNSKQ